MLDVSGHFISPLSSLTVSYHFLSPQLPTSSFLHSGSYFSVKTEVTEESSSVDVSCDFTALEASVSFCFASPAVTMSEWPPLGFSLGYHSSDFGSLASALSIFFSFSCTIPLSVQICHSLPHLKNESIFS